jgi:hypothetical protein
MTVSVSDTSAAVNGCHFLNHYNPYTHINISESTKPTAVIEIKILSLRSNLLSAEHRTDASQPS